MRGFKQPVCVSSGKGASMKLLLLIIAVAVVSAASTNDYEMARDQPTWSKLMSLLGAGSLQSGEPETGLCGDVCYVVDGEENIVLKENEEYTSPDKPCDTYKCTTTGIIKEVITCASTDALEPCPNNGRVVRLPGTCCPMCEKPTPPESQFSRWSEWTPCSKTCGRGTQTRRRDCIIEDEGTRVNCVGQKIEVQVCNAQLCSNKCVWGEWSDWHSCSVTCGSGTELRTRKPVSAYYSGPSCEGPSNMTRLCTLDECLDSDCPSTHTMCGGNCIPDRDHDCINDGSDNCRNNHNPEQLDTDRDGIGNVCDNCETIQNVDQSDNDNDGEGDACDNDDDNDGIFDRFDNCPFIANYKQLPSEKIQYAAECETTGNNIQIDYGETSEEEKKSLIAQIMQMMIKIYS